MANIPRDHDKGWVTVEYANKMVEIAKEQGVIEQQVFRLYMHSRAKNIVEISAAIMQRRPIDEVSDFGKAKEDITKELLDVQGRFVRQTPKDEAKGSSSEAQQWKSAPGTGWHSEQASTGEEGPAIGWHSGWNSEQTSTGWASPKNTSWATAD